MPAGTTLVILRHMDRDDENLNEKGKARAQALIPALNGVKLDAIYSPGIQRNLDSAAPLAKARGLKISRMPAQSPAKRLMAQGGGKSILWMGNKGNLASIWEDLGLPGPPPLQYGDLFIVKADGGTPTVKRMRFGP